MGALDFGESSSILVEARSKGQLRVGAFEADMACVAGRPPSCERYFQTSGFVLEKWLEIHTTRWSLFYTAMGNSVKKVETSTGSRNEQLDGMRGYAAIAVVFFHSILGVDQTMVTRVLYQQNYSRFDSWYDVWAKITLTLFSGQTAVVIFFILSGAVLFESLQKDENSKLVPLAVKFFVKRFLRIYPAMFLCLVACWTAFNYAGLPRTEIHLLQNLALYDFSVNGATWTLNVEAFGAIFLFLAYIAYRKLGEVGIVIVGCVFAAIYLQPFDGYFIQFRMFIYSFFVGILIATPLGKSFFKRLPSQSWPVLLILTIAARHTIQETVAALLVGLVYYRKAGGFGEFLTKPISLFLGRISYSLYLFNVLFLEIFNDRLRSLPVAVAHPVEFGLFSGALIVLLTVPVAYASTRFIEKPFIDFGRYLTQRSRRSVQLSQLPAPTGPM